MLTKERKGEIAYAMLKLRLSKSGIPLNRRELLSWVNDTERVTKIETGELLEFAEMITRDLVEETFCVFG